MGPVREAGRVANVQYNAVKIYMEFRMLGYMGEGALFRTCECARFSILGEGALFRVFGRGCSI